VIQGAAPTPRISVRLRRWFDAPRESVFRAWTDPETLRQWWCPAGWTPGDIEVDLRVAGAYRIGMRNSFSGAAVSVRGRFLEVKKPDRLVYTWQWENAFDGIETRVTVQFAERGTGTEIVLFHEDLPEISVCLRHREAWIAAWRRIDISLYSPK
jgi:uncharacterized protein YndB with AHSA1/START domain